MPQKGWLQIRVDKEILESLDAIVSKTHMNRSVVVRELIPPLEIIEAMTDDALLHKRSLRNMARDCMLPWTYRFTDQMLHDPQEKNEDKKRIITLQLMILTSGLDPEKKIALLYSKWSRAKRGVEGYRFEQIIYKRKAQFTIVIGPDDSDDAIENLKKEILKDAEKLGL